MSYPRFVVGPIKRVLRAMGVDLVRYDLYHSEDLLLTKIISFYEVRTILDVGANIGQYAQRRWEQKFAGKIYSFEPLPEAFRKLSEQAKRVGNWEVFNAGIGSREEDVVINVSENLVSSSMLSVAEASLAAEPATRTTRKEKVSLTTIDAVFSRHTFQESVLLKLDVQGFEQEALQGALLSLSRIRVIQVELSYVEVYRGGPLADEVVRFLKERGFSLFTLIPGFRDEKSGRMLQADGVFVREE